MASPQSTPPAAIRFKANAVTLTVLQINSGNINTIGDELREKLKQSADFFQQVPVMIDLRELGEAHSIDLQPLTQLIKESGLIPVGVRTDQSELVQQAHQLGLAQFLDSHMGAKPTPLSSAKVAQSEESGPTVVNKPIRSGQQVYAKQADLVVLASTSSGAELLADGSIHVYGTLRGRVLAGVTGNTKARIFCQSLEAELVSIAGNYRLLEDLESELSGKPAQIYLDDQDRLIISPL